MLYILIVTHYTDRHILCCGIWGRQSPGGRVTKLDRKIIYTMLSGVDSNTISAPLSKNAVSAFQISFFSNTFLLSFTLEDS